MGRAFPYTGNRSIATDRDGEIVMRRGVLAVVVLCWLWPVLGAAQSCGTSTALVPFASEVLTISGTALSLTKATYQPPGTVATMAVITIEGGDIRYLVTGTPTGTAGHYVPGIPLSTFPICGLESITAFRAIRVSTDAKATITYYKNKAP
jgi:hypothetical protein